MNPFDLTGRVALVTGAGSPTGIGFATARLLGSMGARVVVAGTTDRIRDRATALRGSSIDAIHVQGDLSLPADARRIALAGAEHWGRLDIVVNNAGMVSEASPDFESGSIIDMSLDTWHASLRRNLDTAFLVSGFAAPLLAAQGWGRIVMVSSTTGPVMAMTGDVGYAAAKAGLIGLVRAAALDLAGKGTTVNAVAPGWIGTGSQTDDERLQGLATPLARSGTADEVASAIAWLCTPGASYVTGQCLIVDGGNSIAEQRAASTVWA
ncbi:3-oxoacyl-[acyl-carrier protein] reductase [Nakamurella sp. UYEF19]|uniref:SDR family NAD(P)-dependent oxidoreductase n=1 Tax=Nakamurella sp. UYEF19 TaxID=1756392 RepID=UPI0033907DBB